MNDNIILKNPDVIIPFCGDINRIEPYVVIYVRPTTNKLNYEKNIILAIQEFGEVVYLANINGLIFLKNSLLLTHYSTQFYFAVYSKKVISVYEDMVKKIEDHFHIPFQDINIIGSFDYIEKTRKSPDELFSTIVDDKDFLKFYGQTIKKIDSYYVVNYDIPKIMSDYNENTNVFVVVCKLKDNASISDLNRKIFENLRNDNSTSFVDNSLLCNLSWNEMVRRTYHISQNFLVSIYDILDFVFTPDGREIDICSLPLCSKMFDSEILTVSDFLSIKEFNIVYLKDGNKERIANIIEECNNKSFEEIIDVFKKINYKKIGYPNLV